MPLYLPGMRHFLYERGFGINQHGLTADFEDKMVAQRVAIAGGERVVRQIMRFQPCAYAGDFFFPAAVGAEYIAGIITGRAEQIVYG